jgi:hypothetical protein
LNISGCRLLLYDTVVIRGPSSGFHFNHGDKFGIVFLEDEFLKCNLLKLNKIKGKAIPVTDREGP